MSTVATPSGLRRVWRVPLALGKPGRDIVLGVALAAGLCIATFVTGGGTALAPNTWTEIVLILVCAVLLVFSALRASAARGSASVALLLFALLAAFTAGSIAWSVQPADSWVDASRTVAYLAVFAGAMALARIAPGRWAAVVGAVATVTAVVSAYSVLVKVFPGSLDPGDTFGRLRLPFDYWNAVGLMATLGLVPSLWAGSRRAGGIVGRALAVPALGLLVVTITLSLSRGALVIAVLGLVIWFALARVRLRAVLILAAGLLGGGAVSAWALANHSLTYDRVALPARTHAGHELGLALILMLVLQSIAGLVIALRIDRVAVPEGVRRRVGEGLVVLVVLVALAGVGAVADSSRGLTGTISHAWTQLTSPNSGGAPDQPGRLLQVGSTRGRYWNQALTVGRHAWFKGEGANGFATARTRYFRPINQYQSFEHAHSYVLETFADLGVVGVAISLALLVAWASAAARALSSGAAPHAERGRRWYEEEEESGDEGQGRSTDAEALDPGPRWPAERDALVALLVTAIVFGLNSAIDWTWFIPGPAIVALLCAGWLAGRGSIGVPDAGARPRLGPATLAGAALLAAAVLVGAWMIYQPLRSANADAAGLNAATSGDLPAAVDHARAAATYDPVSVDPLFELAAFYRAGGQSRAALAELGKAVSLQPLNPQTWIQDGETQLALHRPRRAVAFLRRAAQLDRGSPEIAGDLRRAALSAGS